MTNGTFFIVVQSSHESTKWWHYFICCLNSQIIFSYLSFKFSKNWMLFRKWPGANTGLLGRSGLIWPPCTLKSSVAFVLKFKNRFSEQRQIKFSDLLTYLSSSRICFDKLRAVMLCPGAIGTNVGRLYASRFKRRISRISSAAIMLLVLLYIRRFLLATWKNNVKKS